MVEDIANQLSNTLCNSKHFIYSSSTAVTYVSSYYTRMYNNVHNLLVHIVRQ